MSMFAYNCQLNSMSNIKIPLLDSCSYGIEKFKKFELYNLI